MVNMNAVYSPSENSIIQSLFSEIEDLKTRIISLETEKSEVKAELSKAQKLSLFKLLAQDNEIEEDVQTWFDSMLIKSELRPIKRIAELETVTGKNDYSDFEDDEEREPSLLEQITELKESIKTADFCLNLPNSGNIIPETKSGRIAFFIKDFLENDLKERNGQYSLNGNEIKDMIVHTIPEKDPELTPKKGQNIRKLKKDVLGKLKDILGSRVQIDKNKYGRHETRILFKPLQTITS
jgi:vacuolar-type H+-ATPase subunit I/STV1